MPSLPPQNRPPNGLAIKYFVVCQGAWFVTVFGGAHANAVPGLICAAAIAGWHLLRATRPWSEARVIVVVTLAGWMWDSLLVGTGWLVYPGRPAILVHAPLWIAALWTLFAVQLNTVFIWLRDRRWLAAVAGAAGGPLSFRAGAALGAVHFAHPLPAICALAVAWSVILPVSLWLAGRWNGMSVSASQLDRQY
ncbi:DUF2878 domain-containing protein [Burkholderia sp. Ax-1719]|uniref:DUF2878 domain-containing protein n=1 Tax=Burkholderia sp. Ax-1719 TaxID=2608334 RepID=UPI001423EF5D|nr:DUF2878 domain-containing protein [Burkholderia sp. Ax-1719]NIE64384.1 DUF2878 domain-containing protein [Burkholderia sp. Ax-1719]